jgi:CHAT domain-containing protein/tetratricopeptide (TPR) repeat protein
MRGRAWRRGWAALALGVAMALGPAPVVLAQGKGGATASAVAAELNEAERLNREAAELYKAGKYDAAIPMALRSLAIREKALGPNHPAVAASLNNLALLYNSRGEYGRAEPLYQRALAISEKALGPDHPDVAQSLNNLAALYNSRGEYARAEPLYRRALAINEKALGPDHPEVATSLNNLAVLYDARGEYGRAEPLYQRALAISEKALGPDHPAVATSLNNLAELYRARGEYGRAEPLFQRALAIREKALGPDHPEVASSLNNLAGLYKSRGEYGRAEPLYQRALAISEKALGPDHPEVAASLNNLALLYGSRGESGRAEPLYQRALAIAEKALGPDHPKVASSLNNLAELYRAKGEYGRAEPLYQRALAINEKALGPDHPTVAGSLNNLAGLYDSRGESGRAEPLYQRALAIYEKAPGPDHPTVATSLNNLALLYNSRGEYGRAEPLYQRAIAIREKALGPDHPDVAGSLINLSSLYWATNRLPEALRSGARGLDVEEKALARVLAAGSEAQKRAYLATFTGQTYVPITLALQTREPQAARLALTTILRRKGRVLDATASGLSTLRARLGRDEQELLDQLDAARAQYVTLVLRGPGATPLDAYRMSLGTLDEQIREREGAISARSDAFRVEQQPTTLAAVQSAMPDNAALVEWVVYEPFNVKARSNREKWGLAHYAACVLPRHGDPVWVDLGDEKSINTAVQALRAALRRPANAEVTGLARALEAQIMAPVRALLGTTRRIFLSPDGALNLVPFAALVGDNNRPLLERYSFTYLTSGRDLLRLAVQTQTRGAPLVLANPEFDAPGDRRGTGRFSPLLHADDEAAMVARLFPGSTVLLHRDATKQRLRAAHGPRLLHIGTHGYFEPIACMTDPQNAGDTQADALSNPMLRSGVALAGANACASGHDEGLLTAFEASGLDLYGTKLVVLSACQTGVGGATAGDGVYGLRRALVLAGAETQVMSLWPVDGAATADLMKAYYEALAKGGGRSEAMRGVQLAMLHDPRWAHPYYWAGFIVSGDDRSLDDKAVAPDLRVHPGGACACRLGGEAPEGGGGWLSAAAAIGLWIARRRTRDAARPARERLPA